MIERDTTAEITKRFERRSQLDAASDVEGHTLGSLWLRSIAARESIPQAVVLRIVLDVVEALQAFSASSSQMRSGLHVRIVLAPEAVQVDKNGRARLLDPAALAAVESSAARRAARAPYVAPEHIDGGGHGDVRGHIFSLGILLWEMLACRSLFGAATFEQVRERVLFERISRVQRERFFRGEPIAAALATVVARALQRDREQRFQSYAELAQALRSAGTVADHGEVAEFVRDGLREASASTPCSDEPPAAASEAPAEPSATVEMALIRLDDAPSPLPVAGTGHAIVLRRVGWTERLRRVASVAWSRAHRARAVFALSALALLTMLAWLALRDGDAPAESPTPPIAAPHATRGSHPTAATPRPAPVVAAKTRVDAPAEQPPSRSVAASAPEPEKRGAAPAPIKRPRPRTVARPRAGAAQFMPNDI